MSHIFGGSARCARKSVFTAGDTPQAAERRTAIGVVAYDAHFFADVGFLIAGELLAWIPGVDGAAGVTAGIVTVAEEAVIAWCRIAGVYASDLRVTGIISAAVPVITGWGCSRDATPGGEVAPLNPGTEVVVRAVTVLGAATRYRGRYTSNLSIAAVTCTDLAVVAAESGSADTDAARAGVGSGAGVAVVAGNGVVGMDAT
jgi:hypothetical protein